jgi:uncharacterized repeat protein (TIGR04052 family)
MWSTPTFRATALSALGLCALVLSGCSDSTDPEDSEQPFTLNFAAVYQGDVAGCGDQLAGFGPAGTASIELSDLRFYISDLRFYDEQGVELPLELDDNEFQYNSADGNVALIDLTSTGEGACAGTGLSFPEGTARTNAVITGTSRPDDIHSISFAVGIPQHLMKQVLATHTDADAPSPLAEMHWSWAYAYRHLVANFTIAEGEVPGEGYVHVGSTDCGGDGTRAMTDRETCGKLNTPVVHFEHFHADDTVGLDLGALLAGIDFQVESSPGGPLVPGVASHSSPGQPDTGPVFTNLGIDMGSGSSTAAANTVFVVH